MGKIIWDEFDRVEDSQFNMKLFLQMTATVIIAGLFLGFSLWGHIEKSTLTATKTVPLETVRETSYDVAPYHGGRIFKEYAYTGTYSYMIDGTYYRVEIESRSRRGSSDLPVAIVVRYDPFNSWNQIVDEDDNPDLGLWMRVRMGKDGRYEQDE